MIPFIFTAIFAFLLYLLFTAGSGDVGLWSATELAAGVILSIVIAALSRNFFCTRKDIGLINPVRWVMLVVYAAVPFFLEMARANLDVAYRVITGRIRPGIVRISPGLSSDLGVLFLANSITLTPGTLTVDVDEETNDLFVHMINIEPGREKADICDCEDVFVLFQLPDWIRRIAE
jgi:multicomponent Na+:H+ antiporter subunit E